MEFTFHWKIGSMRERKSNRPLSSLPGKKRFWIARFPKGEPRATVLLGHTHSDVSGLFSTRELEFLTIEEITDRNLIGIGDVWHFNSNKYYYSNTYIRPKYRGQGLGDDLYKLLLLATRKVARADGIAKSEIEIGCHEAAGSLTSQSAWRCYSALHRKGYLKPTSRQNQSCKTDWFNIIKWPKKIKARSYVVSV